MGLPEIFISFQTAAVSAITRSARGVLAVAVKDATEGGAAETAYKSLAEVPEDKFSPENYRLLKLAFLAAPTKVWVLRVGEDAEKTYQALERLRFDWLAAPGLEDARVMSFIKTLRNGGRGVKAVVANATAPDCEGIVNLCVSGLTLEDGAMEAKDYAVRVAALLTALALWGFRHFISEWNWPQILTAAAVAGILYPAAAGMLLFTAAERRALLDRCRSLAAR